MLFIILLLLLYIYNAPCIRVKNLLKGANKVMLNNFICIINNLSEYFCVIC